MMLKWLPAALNTSDKRFQISGLWRGQYLSGFTLFSDASIGQVIHILGLPSNKGDLMRNKYDADAIQDELSDNVSYLSSEDGIEIGSYFVAQDVVGLHDYCSCQRDARELSCGQLSRVFQNMGAEPQTLYPGCGGTVSIGA